MGSGQVFSISVYKCQIVTKVWWPRARAVLIQGRMIFGNFNRCAIYILSTEVECCNAKETFLDFFRSLIQARKAAAQCKSFESWFSHEKRLLSVVSWCSSRRRCIRKEKRELYSCCCFIQSASDQKNLLRNDLKVWYKPPEAREPRRVRAGNKVCSIRKQLSKLAIWA